MRWRSRGLFGRKSVALKMNLSNLSTAGVLPGDAIAKQTDPELPTTEVSRAAFKAR